MSRISHISIALIALLLSVIVYWVYTFKHYASIGKQLASHTVPFAVATNPVQFSILVIGDSTVVGTGARDPLDSTAGRLSKDFPDTTIVNAGKNGMRVKGLIDALDLVDKQRFDIVLIQIGGNDITHFTNDKDFEQDLDLVLEHATRITSHILLVNGGDVGTAPLFPWPLRKIYTQRTHTIHAISKKVADNQGIIYVEILNKDQNDPFAQDPHTYYAADMFHPSSDGYGVWYDHIRQALNDNDLLPSKASE